MHQDTEYYMTQMSDEPEYRLAKEMYLDQRRRKEIGKIIGEARYQGLSKDETRELVREFFSDARDLQDRFDDMMQQFWWDDWPFIECIAYDEAGLEKCRCESCVAIKTQRMHREEQAREFEAMLEDLREKAKKPWYKGWEVP
jgi:hypothetical protein